jgi:hypothetical protein
MLRKKPDSLLPRSIGTDDVEDETVRFPRPWGKVCVWTLTLVTPLLVLGVFALVASLKSARAGGLETRAYHALRRIDGAERLYKERHGVYGELSDLVTAGLLASEDAREEQDGIRLCVEVAEHRLMPTRSPGPECTPGTALAPQLVSTPRPPDFRPDFYWSVAVPLDRSSGARATFTCSEGYFLFHSHPEGLPERLELVATEDFARPTGPPADFWSRHPDFYSPGGVPCRDGWYPIH